MDEQTAADRAKNWFYRQLAPFLFWKARRDYDRELARERQHLLHDLQEAQ